MDSVSSDVRGVGQSFAALRIPSVLDSKSSQPIVVIGKIPSDAIAHGLEPLLLGYEEIMLSPMNENVATLVHHKMRLQALQSALDYACNWAFATGYKIVFNSRIGLTPVHGGEQMNLAVFLSFHPPEEYTGTDTPHSYPTRYRTRETAQTATVQECGGSAEMGRASAPQQGATAAAANGMSRATKRWVAGRILHLLLRCCGRTAFLQSLWFMEDPADGRPDILLLPYTLNMPDNDSKATNDSTNQNTQHSADPFL
jgi:hypothetical protein